MYDIQKATLSKRISAFLFDLIIFFVVVVGVGSVFSGIVGYDEESSKLNKITAEYTQEYIYDAFNIKYGTTLGPEEIDKELNEKYDTYKEWYEPQVELANTALRADEEAMDIYYNVIMLSILNVTISILIAYILLEIVVPLLFKNGQTIGKKTFGIALMRIDGVKISPLQLTVRTILGKYTIETMIPLLAVLSVYFSLISPDLVLFALAVIAVLVIVECVLFFKSGMTDFIHDKMALTICVDVQSQLIFENEDELIEYKRTHPTTTGDGKPMSPIVESLFNVYSGAGRAENVESEENNSYSGIQLGTIDVDSSDVFAEKEAEYREKLEAEQSSEEAAPTEVDN
ncbi:MAG: RDD family protein, partial [Paludibacteraceae bacterium]|nr:RDD family protein [Paludibacteraceae bacterium]